MTHRNDELKAQMMAQAQAAIEALLAERDKKGELDLSDVEQLVREAGQRVMQELTADLANAEAAAEKEVLCPICGQKPDDKGKKGRDLVTDTADIRLERGHYYCPTCRKGFFPPRPTVGVDREHL